MCRNRQCQNRIDGLRQSPYDPHVRSKDTGSTRWIRLRRFESPGQHPRPSGRRWLFRPTSIGHRQNSSSSRSRLPCQQSPKTGWQSACLVHGEAAVLRTVYQLGEQRDTIYRIPDVFRTQYVPKCQRFKRFRAELNASERTRSVGVTDPSQIAGGYRCGRCLLLLK